MTEETFVWKDTKRALFGFAWTFTKYALTDEKLLIKTGLFNQKEDEVRLYRIMDITLKRSFEERLFGLGTIHCCSADKSSAEFDIRRVKNAAKVKNMLSDMVEQQRMTKRVTNREYMDADESDDVDDDSNE